MQRVQELDAIPELRSRVANDSTVLAMRDVLDAPAATAALATAPSPSPTPEPLQRHLCSASVDFGRSRVS